VSCASSQNNIGHAGLDHGHPRDYRFHTRGTNAINGDSNGGLRYASHEGGNSGHIKGVCRFQTAAKPYIIKHVRLNSNTFYGLLHGHASNGGRVHVSKCAPKCPNSRATGGNNNHVFHGSTSIQINGVLESFMEIGPL